MPQEFIGIQLLRFAAAMLVVAMHITQAHSIYITGAGGGNYWESGSAGVDIFFVISGFVMGITTANLPKTQQSRFSAAWVFIKRRFMRIAPLYWFYTLLKVCLLLTLPSLAMKSSIDSGHLAASLLFLPAVSPWNAVEPLLPVGWTLNFEMLFYAVFAVAIALGAPRIRFCLLVFLLLFLASQHLPASVSLRFYARSIVFEFILGVCISHAYVHFRRGPPGVGLLLFLAGGAFIFAVGWGPETDRLTSWGFGAALAVLGIVWLEPWTARRHLTKRLAFFGDASYSIYLSHTFVVPAGVMLLRKVGISGAVPIMLAVSLTVVMTGCLAYVLIERPMTNFLKRAFFTPLKPNYPNIN